MLNCKFNKKLLILENFKVEEKINKFAIILSYIFNGTLISIPVSFIICLKVVGNVRSAIGWAFICLLFSFLIPYFYIIFMLKRNAIIDFHVPNRKERIKPLIIINISYMIGYLTLYILEAPLFLKSIFAVSVVSTVILTIVTYFWKISLHTSWITFIVITFNILFGRWMLLMIPLIPVIGWARVRIKEHTINQVIFGIGISTITTFFIYYNYGLINLF